MWSHMEPAVLQSHKEEAGKACNWFINIADGDSIPYSSYINHFITILCVKPETVMKKVSFGMFPVERTLVGASLEQHGCKECIKD